ncbi:MAG: hypothetical protein JWN17_2380 [Frankiales bacterium]|nr:hypothetical protein [Frankiales bacterium]
MTTGSATDELSDLDLVRELAYAHSRRHDTFVNGSAHALANHSRRTAELELAYARRFGDVVAEAEQKVRDLSAG